MKGAAEFVFKVLQSVLLSFLVLVIGALLFAPSFFSERAENTFRVLKEHNLVLEVNSNGARFLYSPEEIKSAFATESKLDALVVEARCLADETCTFADQEKFAELLGIDAVAPAPSEFQSTWVVIFGGDETLEQASFELQKLSRKGYDLDLVKLDNWYRSVAKYPSQDAADAGLSEIRAEIGRNDSYVRLLHRWCPDPKRVNSQPGFLECSG